MNFNENSARKVINFLLKDDNYEYKRWIPQINKFNSEQIENLFNGNRNYENKAIKHRDMFDRLVQKFENFQKILYKWYEKEGNYQYLKQLWKNYIAIEELNEYISESKIDEQQLTNYLESHNVQYKNWPKEVKEEFLEEVKETVFTYIHEEKFKEEINKEHSGFKQCMNMIKSLKDSFKNLTKNVDKYAQKQFEKLNELYSSKAYDVVKNFFTTLIIPSLISVKGSINYKAQEQFLVKQILEYIPNKCDAKTIAHDIIYENFTGVDSLKWKLERNYGLGGQWCDGFSKISNLDCDEKYISIDLEGKDSESLSKIKTIKTIFKNKMFTGFIALASFTNLCFCAKEFYDVSQLLKSIKAQDYQDKLNEIKESFRSHLDELNLNCNYENFVLNLQYVKQNIENDKKRLGDLIADIIADEKILESKEKRSKYGLGCSCLLGLIGIGGLVLTGGGYQIAYGFSTLCNIISGAGYSLNISECSKTIEELEKIRKDAEKENQEIQKQLDKINLLIKQKDSASPTTLYKECEDLFEKQNKKMILLNNYF